MTAAPTPALSFGRRPRMAAGFIGGTLWLYAGLAIAFPLTDPWSLGGESPAALAPYEQRLAIPAPAAPVLPDHPLTLAELTALALRQHPDAQAAFAAAQAEAFAFGVARAEYFPELIAVLGGTRSKPLSSAGVSAPIQTRYGPSLTLSYVLYDFGQRAARVDAQGLRALGARLANTRVLQELTLAVEQAYYEWLATAALADAQQRAVEHAQTSLDAAQRRREAGLATVGDVYRAEAVLAEARLAVVQTQGETVKARGRLAVAVGLPPDAALRLATSPPGAPFAAELASVETLLAQAVRQRPDLAAGAAAVEAARADAAAARAAGRPSLELSGTLGRTSFAGERPTSDSFNVGLNLRIPLFRGFGDRYAQRQALAEAARTGAQRDALYRDVQLAVWQAAQDYASARAARENAQSQFRSAGLAAEVALARYENGVGTLLELLTAQADAAAAEGNQIRADLDGYLALAHLAHAMGGALPGDAAFDSGAAPASSLQIAPQPPSGWPPGPMAPRAARPDSSPVPKP